ncbi:MAG: crossover junction endodeoxyribonuclease RuvC [Oscillospiraceae bacterium]
MRILGIDPGYAITGYGCVDYNGYKFTPVRVGAITTKAHTDFSSRLLTIYNDLNELITLLSPQEIAIERLYFTTNQKTAIDVAQARGVVVLCATQHGIPVYEYTPLQVKQSVVGYGKAEKKQVMEMTKNILNLKETAKPDDAADALAIAICHGHSRSVCAYGDKK